MDLIEYDSTGEQDGIIIAKEENSEGSTQNQVNLSPQFYLISSGNGFPSNTANPILIAPKIVQGTLVEVTTSNEVPSSTAKVPIDRVPSNRHHNGGAASSAKTKKRDERRRVTHNEVERRRRDKINQWIEKLGQLIPVDGEPIGCVPLVRPNIADSSAYSKGGILSMACDYVTALHNKVNTLNECQKESKKISAETLRLRDANAQLVIENDQLRQRLRQMGAASPKQDS